MLTETIRSLTYVVLWIKYLPICKLLCKNHFLYLTYHLYAIIKNTETLLIELNPLCPQNLILTSRLGRRVPCELERLKEEPSQLELLSKELRQPSESFPTA
jgi:hypothetical protein